MTDRTRRAAAAIAALFCCAVLAALPSRAQEETPAPRGGIGRYAPQPDAQEPLATLDTYTGVVYLIGAEAGAVDLPNARSVLRAIAKDVTGGTMVLPAIPNAPGAGAPVFAWAPAKGKAFGILDTRNGVHWALQGGPDAGTVERLDLRLGTRSTRELHAARSGK